MNNCNGCFQEGIFSILLAGNDDYRYIPNQSVREHGDIEEVWFCDTCMRRLEDSFRATLIYLRSENKSFVRRKDTDVLRQLILDRYPNLKL